MKSERRHELEKNVLRDWLFERINQAKPYINLILSGILAVLILVIVAMWWADRSAAQAGAAWDAYFAVFAGRNASPADFEKVAEKNAATSVSFWASLTAADRYLGTGCDQLFVNKVAANQDLRKAVEKYMAVLAASKVPAVRERATFGLARAREAQGDLEKAVEGYQQIVKDWPHGAFAKMAQERAADLKRMPIKEFYDKFAKFDPKPPIMDEPGTPGKKPAFDLDSLPDKPTKPTALPKLEEKSEGEIKFKSAPAPEPEKSKDAEKAGGAKAQTPASPTTPTEPKK